MAIKAQFSNFSKKYPYLLNEDRVEYFSLFGGIENYELNLFESIDVVIEGLIENRNIINIFPFFILDEPFKKLLLKLSYSDGKMYSIFKRVGIGEELGLELVDELIESNIIYISNSRELPLKSYQKQKIKKEFKYYEIEPKIYFTKPFYRFWFAHIEPYRDKENSLVNTLNSYNKWGYKLTSLVYEQLSIEVLKEYYRDRDKLVEVGSYWDIHSEFDIYCKTSSGKFIVGECKYKNRPITHSELLKLKAKVLNSNLRVDTFVLFSKSGFSQEFYRNLEPNLLLFDLSSLNLIL